MYIYINIYIYIHISFPLSLYLSFSFSLCVSVVSSLFLSRSLAPLSDKIMNEDLMFKHVSVCAIVFWNICILGR